MKWRLVILAASAGWALGAGCMKAEDDNTSVSRTDVTERDRERMGEPVVGKRISGSLGMATDAGTSVQLDPGTGGSGLAGTECEEGANAHGGGSLRSNAVHCEGQGAAEAQPK